MVTETETRSQAPRWLRVTIYAQVVIAVFAVSLSFLAAWELKPLLMQREELRSQVASLNTQLKSAQSELATYREALDAAREGINEYHAGNYAGAVANYDSALKLDPNNAYLLDLKGYSLFKGRRLDDAVATLLESVRADPKYAWGYFDLARVYCAAGKFSDAKTAADMAVSISSTMRSKMDADGEFRRLCQPILKKG